MQASVVSRVNFSRHTGGKVVLLALQAVFASIWETGFISADWKTGLVVPIWKGMGDHLYCGKYIGITTISVPSKVLARVILNRIGGHLLAYQQLKGNLSKKYTIDHILVLRVCLERKCICRQSFFVAFVDFHKAFDSFDQVALSNILRLWGIPLKLLYVKVSLYSRTVSAMQSVFFLVNSCSYSLQYLQWLGVGQGNGVQKLSGICWWRTIHWSSLCQWCCEYEIFTLVGMFRLKPSRMWRGSPI